MSLFGLDPESVFSRVTKCGQATSAPGLSRSILIGTGGFTLASLVVYGSWALHGRELYRGLGEAGAYAVWAVLFIALAGGLLNPIVIGPRSLLRFYFLFAAAFTGYPVLWSASWFLVRGRAGEWLGSLLGSAALALVLSAGFGLKRERGRVVLVLFAAHSAGYFLGGWVYESIARSGSDHWIGAAFDRSTRAWLSKLGWGLFHGVGLGGGIAYTIYHAQSGVRELLRGGPAETPTSRLAS